MRLRFLAAAIAALLLVLPASAYAKPAREGKKQLALGVLAFRPKQETRALWEPVIVQVNRSLPDHEISLDVLTYQEMDDALQRHRLDFVLTNPAHYIEIRYRYSMTGVLATLVEQQGLNALSAFGGTIIARSDRSDLSKITDLRNRTISIVGKNSLGGYQAQAYELLRAGIVKPERTRLIARGMPHDQVVQDVLDGTADAGFVRSGLVEQMAAEGKLDMGKIRILNRQDMPHFPYAVSTHLYPEWPFIALSHVDEGLAAQVASAILGIKHHEGTMEGYGFHGFTVPADYSAVETLLRELRLPPFDVTPAFTVQDVWQRYRIMIITTAFAATIIGGLLIFLLVLNRRLRTEQRKVRESETKYRMLFDSAADAIVIHDAAGRILSVNAAACGQYGYSLEELLAMSVARVDTPEQAVHAPERIRKLMEEGSIQFETMHRRKDGSDLAIDVKSQRILWDGLPAMMSICRDITERKRAIEAVEKWAHIFKHAQWGITVGSGDGKTIELMNPMFAAMHGYSVEELTGQQIINLFAPECRAAVPGQIKIAHEKGHYTWESIHLRKDGSTFPVLIDVTTVYDDRNAVQYRVVNVQDITERRRTEEEIKRLATEQRIILHTIPLGVAFVKDRKLVWTNPFFERIFGYAPGDARDVDAKALYAHHADYERVGREGYAVINAGGVYTTEVQSERKDGGTFWLSLTGRAVNPDTVAEGSIWIMEDITKRKATEDTLRESERLFRESIEFMPMPIGIANADGTIRRYNKSFVETYGYTVQDIPTIAAWLQNAYPDDTYRERCRQVWDVDVRKAVIEQGSTPTREYEVTCRNGRVKNVEITMRPIGSLFIATFYDVTARKRVEKDLVEKTLQLEDLTRDLERRVQQEVELRRANEQMMVQQSKLAAMGEMLGAIAHQWRQPLNILGLIIQNLKDAHTFGELNREAIEQAVQKSMSQIRHMSKTIDDFRTFFQPDKERSVFDAMQATGEVLSLFAAQLAANGIDFQLTCKTHGKSFTRVEDIVPCKEKSVNGFRNEFEHVIMNLINNAREAVIERREGGDMPAQERGLISFEFRNDSGKIVIEVSDNGGGIPHEVIDRIFEPYFTTKGPATGTGLGLYMSTVIVKDHMQGRVTAKNRGPGAVFTIELPQA